jgi:hypothetical protein
VVLTRGTTKRGGSCEEWCTCAGDGPEKLADHVDEHGLKGHALGDEDGWCSVRV